MSMKSDPWGTTSSSSSPWGVEETNSTSDWLSSADTTHEVSKKLFEDSLFPLQDWIDGSLNWVVDHFRDFFLSVKIPIDATLSGIEHTLQSANPFVVIAIFTLISWQFGSKKLAIGTLFSLLFIGVIGIWSKAMITLALVFTSVIFCIIIGIPIGIYMAKSRRATMIIQPILDAMQTTPAFVYLIPIVMLFSTGNVSGTIVTTIFALPPLIRLTSLGIKQVPEDLIEASHAFGASPLQMLFRVELPVAMPTIMAGVNQTLMLSLSMVVIASMIAVGGLGQMVLRGIGRIDMGLAAVGGIGIVLLAIILDRLTQAMGKKDLQIRHWYLKGPVGIVYKFIRRKR